MPVKHIHGVILEKLKHNIVAVCMNGVHPAAVCCLEHAQIIRNAEFLVFRNSHKIKGGILRCKKHAVGTGFDHSLCHFAGGLGDHFQRMVYGIAAAFL